MSIEQHCNALDTMLHRAERADTVDDELKDEAQRVYLAIISNVEQGTASAQTKAYKTLLRYHELISHNPKGKLDCYHRLKALGQY